MSTGLREFLRKLAAACLFAVALAIAACSDNGKTEPAASAEPPGVIVIMAQDRPFIQSVEFIGETEAFQKVDLRARVTGFLVEKGFEDGALVRNGSVLFRIDPSEYQAALSSAQAGLERAQAELMNARQQLERTQTLIKNDTVSKAQLDERVATEAAARANVSAAEAEVKKAELNLGYTQIVSPIDGRIGKSRIDVGNLIGPENNVLASVVAQDPVRVVFSVSEKIFLSVQERRSERDAIVPRIRLANGEIYEHAGKLLFVDNEVDARTGTIRAYVEFPNPDGILLPGLYVTVVLSGSEETSRILVPQSAVQIDQAGAFVLIVDAESKVGTRRVTTGDRRDGDIVILEGLEAGETVIVDGIQKVRPGMTVNPTQQSA